jgi:hypothetical protein
VQLAQLACTYAAWLLPGLMGKLAQQLPWNSKPLHAILDSVLSLPGATELVLKKLAADPAVCEAQVGRLCGVAARRVTRGVAPAHAHSSGAHAQPPAAGTGHAQLHWRRCQP